MRNRKFQTNGGRERIGGDILKIRYLLQNNI